MVIGWHTQAAFMCGWDVAATFQGAASQKHFASIYNDVVICLPAKRVWRECAGNLIEAATTDVRVLTVLADVFEAVASLQVFAPKSPNWDEFVDLLLPTAKRFVQSFHISALELQHQRIALQVLLHLVEIYEGCSTALLEILWMGPLPDVRDVVVELLSTRGVSYLAKADALNVLAHFSHDPQAGASTEALIGALNTFMAEEFPIVSTDVKVGTKEYDVYNLLFRQLLVIVEESRCVRFLKLLYPSLREGASHLFANELSCALARFADKLANPSGGDEPTVVPGSSASSHMEAATPSSLLELADVLLDPRVDVAIRKTLLECVFTPVVELQQQADVVKTFFLSECDATLSSKMTMLSKLSTLIANSADVTATGSFFSAAVAYALVELLFRLADPELIRTEINSAFLGHANGKGREFTMLVCKCASKVVTKAYGSDASDTVRFACCEAYNCLLTAVSKTQKQEKFFGQILFQEALWGNIIDVSRAYDLRAQIEQFPKIPLSTLSTSTRRVQQQSQDPVSRTNRRRDASSALQFFTGSSLSQSTSLGSASFTQPTSGEQHVVVDGVSPTFGALEIELDVINDHPSMVPLLRVLVVMKNEFGANWTSASMPGWMHKMYSVVANSLTELNIRLFLVKVVLNAPELFTLHASAWLEKVVEVVLEATCSGPSSKTPEFNYLLRDCCHLALGEWKDVALSLSLTSTLSRFVTTLVKLSPHRTTAIMRDNIVLVSELILAWKDAIVLDTSAVDKFLFTDEPNARLETAERVTALQTLSAMLTAGTLTKFQAEAQSVYSRSITDGIVLALQHQCVAVYTVAAEVAGLYLKHFDWTSEEAFARAVASEIAKAYNDEDYARFLSLLRNVSLHSARVVDAMMLQRLCSLLPKVLPIDSWARLASEALEHASTNGEVVRLVFPSVHPVLSRLLNHRDAGVQYTILRMMDSISDALSPLDLELVLKSTSDGGLGLLSHYRAHIDTSCRKLMYAMAMRFFRIDATTGSVKDELHRTLLGGLSDGDAAIREELLAFWSDSDLLPTASSLRLLALFDSLHAPELADKWVLYAPNLLVLLTKSAAAFDTPLFPSALTAAEFYDTEIDVAWERKTQTMAPMFSVESDMFASKQSRGGDYGGDLSQGFLGTLTQDALGEGTIHHHSQLVSTSLYGTYGPSCCVSRTILCS